MSADLLDASRREAGLYRELGAVYGRLEAALVAADGGVDPTLVSAGRAQATALTTALAEIGAYLAPHRLLGDVVDATVAACWRESATLAAAAYEANQRLAASARLRQAEVGERLGAISAARRAHAGYRTAAAR